jgi:hypothetical protein
MTKSSNFGKYGIGMDYMYFTANGVYWWSKTHWDNIDR